MVNYPSQLTSEEKALRKRYSKLQEKLKELKHYNTSKVSSPQGSSFVGVSKKPLVKKGSNVDKKVEKSNPKDALAAAKKLVETGKVNITKNSAKTTGFKRVGEIAGTSKPPTASTAPTKRSSSSFPPSYIPSGSKTPVNKAKPAVPKREESRQLYSRFIRASQDVTHHKIPKRLEETADYTPTINSSEEKTTVTSYSKRECSVYVSWRDIQLLDDALQKAFSRFGSVMDVKLQSNTEAFVTFDTPNIAKTVQREMNKGMIHGTEIRVDFASDENGFIELPPEAASQPWARIAAGMELSNDLSSRKRTASSRQATSYEQDF